ncbi:hypothetical protein RchiOBHm_Chr1g0316361 [Rosa chinensis]|uniref:Uncharacterized protein n=1 Tax=Rosa chinensis TaxID=74649 RepID=A0A2P6S7Q4_ROSCH|nr:hypothetical protein RchiOBHm_Chr1g0316361 [Rosa chinensis]
MMYENDEVNDNFEFHICLFPDQLCKLKSNNIYMNVTVVVQTITQHKRKIQIKLIV